ncbi:hypothetical protein F5Y04DRAFT_45577 [Hypomontagnella monticulosa]|nr:hypothetical protein F5Y04DRAFT_45577 [Hypomontagnella monticulosa]
MKFSAQQAVLGFSFLQTLVAGSAIPRAPGTPQYFRPHGFTRRDLSVTQVQQELGPQLSNGSLLFGPSDPRWYAAIERYSTHAIPDVEIVVQPATEKDVSTIVKYCNDNSIEFLAVNRGHSRSYSVAAFKGMQIDMAGLLDITIQPDGKSAWFQGGTYDGQVMEYLWERGYVATTGSCSCVGMMGPGLGGGHGRQEGFYGMISDNLRNLNVVLADGTAVRVNSTSHADLLWGMKGAGHNFGIVTSFELNIYPREVDSWHYHTYTWKGDKLDTVINALNKLHGNGTTPVNMAVNFGSFLLNTSVSTTEASLWWTFGYKGTAEEANKVLKPFNDIGAEYEEFGDVPYPQISDMQGTGIGGPLCAKNASHTTSTVNLLTYNLTAERQIYNRFSDWIKEYPELGPTAQIVHEGYSTEAVDKFPADDSAFPFRADRHLMLFDVQIPTENPRGINFTTVAREWAQEVQTMWNEGQPTRIPGAYVNYANSLEGPKMWYGHEQWRQDRLLALKKKYDPQNRFRFYNPIVSEATTA